MQAFVQFNHRRLLLWLLPLVIVTIVYAVLEGFDQEQQVTTQQVNLLFEIDGPLLDEPDYEKQLKLLTTIALSEAVAFNTLQNPKAEPWIMANEQFDAAALALQQAIQVEPVAGTNLLKIQMTSNRLVGLNEIALAFGDALIEQVQANRDQAQQQKIQALQATQTTKEDTKTLGVPSKQVAELQRHRSALMAKIQELEKGATPQTIQTPVDLHAGTYSHQMLLARVREREQQQQQLLDGLNDDHPLFNSVKAELLKTQHELTALENQMGALNALVTRNNQQTVEESRKLKIQALKQEVTKLDQSIAKISAERPTASANPTSDLELFMAPEMLETGQDVVKKNELQLTLHWFNKPSP